MRVHQDEVDGVPLLWADLPGVPRAGLSVRVGVADEPLVLRGISHLMEHLALHGLGRPGDHSNGHVDLTETSFHARAEPVELAAFLDRLTRQLGDPPTGRLEDERGLLRSEAAGRSATALSELLTWRYGARSYGVLGQEELGLYRVSAEDLREWAATYATRQNAVLWMTCPPPAGLRVTLPDGVRREAPDPEAGLAVPTPAWYRAAPDGVSLHALVPTGYPAHGLAHVLRTRLVDELRERRAVAYAPATEYRVLTADRAQLVAVTDLVAGRQSEGVRYFLGLAAELAGDEASGGVREDEVESFRTKIRRALEDPAAGPELVPGVARRVLIGRAWEDLVDPAAALAALTPADLAAVADTVARGALAGVPPGLQPRQEPWQPAPNNLAEPVHGRQFKHAEAPEHRGLLILDDGPDGGLTARSPEGGATVRVGMTEAVLRWDDGRRVLVGSDANSVTVEPRMWRDGDRLVEAVDRLWPPGLVVPMGSRRPGDIPSPRSRRQLFQERVTRRLGGRWFWVMLGLALVVVVAASLGLLALIVRPAPFLLGALGWYLWDRRKKRRAEAAHQAMFGPPERGAAD